MLEGIRIVEVEALGPGPFAAMLLADLGADVVTIHRKQGPSAPSIGEGNPLDRGKRSIALDLKDASDLQTARALIATADGLIEGFRPGVMERLGLGPEECRAANRALVYGRMTGWGQSGPKAQLAGHDLNYVATSGALWYTSLPGDPPMTPPTLVGDIGGGALYLVIGLLSGILRARVTGEGTVVDAAIVDGSAHMMNLLMALSAGNFLSIERGRSLLDGPHWCRTYRAADGGFVSVQCLEPKFYAEFLQKMGLAGDPAFFNQYDVAAWPTLAERLAGIFAKEPRAHWAALFEGSDACVAPVLDPAEAAVEPHMAARNVWHGSAPSLQAAPAPRFMGEARWTPRPAPKRGQHTEEILAELESGGTNAKRPPM